MGTTRSSMFIAKVAFLVLENIPSAVYDIDNCEEFSSSVELEASTKTVNKLVELKVLSTIESEEIFSNKVEYITIYKANSE